jgi:PAS domain S-box-containing protein
MSNEKQLSPQSSALSPKSLRVLIIEDSEDDALLLERELRKGGYEPVSERVDTPEALITALRKQDWDVIISDYAMPRFSGLNALKIYKESGHDMPFIIVSGNIGEDVAVEAMRAGAHDYILKGNFKRLVPAVERELREAEVRRERRAVEDTLKASETRYRQLFDNSLDAIILAATDGRIIAANQAACRMFGMTEEGLLSAGIGALMDLEMPRVQVFAEERRHTSRARSEVILKRADGTGFPAEQASVVYTDRRGNSRISLIIRDISDRRRAEEDLLRSQEALRNLAAHLQSVREEERTNIAREIHDQLGQMLTGLALDMHWLTRKYADHLPIVEKVKSMVNITDTAIQTVKKIASELRPGILDHFGITAAIQWQANDIKERSGIACDVRAEPARIILDRDRATTIFRIFQEAATNILRHAEATTMKVDLRQSGNSVELTVTDNGKGITEEQIFSPMSLGMIGIKERVFHWGGEVTISGAPAKGTTLRVSIPLQ